MKDTSPFPYDGPDALAGPVLEALTRVVDPEVAMSIVDVGLVYGVRVSDGTMHVRITMTSAACPVVDVIVEEVEDVIVEEVEDELDRIAPPDMKIAVELVWEPPWTTDRMSERAKCFMGW
jgi:metal-sulfur cluster biosynthetic enzyme